MLSVDSQVEHAQVVDVNRRFFRQEDDFHFRYVASKAALVRNVAPLIRAVPLKKKSGVQKSDGLRRLWAHASDTERKSPVLLLAHLVRASFRDLRHLAKLVPVDTRDLRRPLGHT